MFFHGRDLKDKLELFEVFFKGYHVIHFPWGENKEEVPLFDQFTQVPVQDKGIAVTRLCHFTHDEQAAKIQQLTSCTFIPKKKHGKSLSFDRKSYMICNPTDKVPNDETQYRYISESDELIPGFLSWWSIDIDESCRFHYNSQDLQKSTGKYYVHDGFIKPHQSCYGNVMFSIDLPQLLQCYQKAFEDKPLPRILLRCGGTLRYKREIMKVIIVCREEDLPGYPEFPTGEFNLEYDLDGKVTPRGILELVIKNGVTGSCPPQNSKC